MQTKTVTNPHTQKEHVLISCDACDGHGTYWRPEIFAWWPCHKCIGFGCLDINEAAHIVPHPHANDIPYKPSKGRP